MLANGDTVAKHCLRVSAYGDVDEVNAVVGLLRSELLRTREGLKSDDAKALSFESTIQEQCAEIQQQLFNLGAELATPVHNDDLPVFHVTSDHILRLEERIDAMNEKLQPLKSFILPGGGPASAMAHLARTVCRRAERSVLQLAENESLRQESYQYLNRLSDYFFVLSRACAQAFDQEEVLWDPKTT